MTKNIFEKAIYMSSRVLPKGPTKEQKNLRAHFTKNDKKSCGVLYEQDIKYTSKLKYQKFKECIDNPECNCVYIYTYGINEIDYIGLSKNKTVSDNIQGLPITAYIKK